MIVRHLDKNKKNKLIFKIILLNAQKAIICKKSQVRREYAIFADRKIQTALTKIAFNVIMMFANNV